jgi:DNA helicase IV
MLARRSLSGSMTVVGDIAQATGAWTPTRWDQVVAHLAPKHEPRLVELTVSYRTPAEVVEVAARALRAAVPELAPPTPVRRSGHRPVIEAVARGALASRVAEVAAEHVSAVAPGRAAVLAPEVLLPELHRALVERGREPVDPRVPAGVGLGAPLVLLPAGEAHGLEFDAVVVVEPAGLGDGADSGGERPPSVDHRGLRTLYVALTRPTQRLAVLHALPLPVDLAAD